MFAAAEAGGEKIDLDTLFDSNCITPGTPFMAELHEHIQFFIQKKVREDPVWQRFQTIYSGHNVPVRKHLTKHRNRLASANTCATCHRQLQLR